MINCCSEVCVLLQQIQKQATFKIYILKMSLHDGQFPVYTTESCPRNHSEWSKRSSAINCSAANGYMCLPNDQFTELQEFCYKLPRLAVTKGGTFRPLRE